MHKIMEYGSLWPSFILSSNTGHIHSLPQAFMFVSQTVLKVQGKNLWTMKYRSLWHMFIMRLLVGLYWLIIPSYHFYTSNIVCKTWAVKYRSQWPTLCHSDPLYFAIKHQIIPIIPCYHIHVYQIIFKIQGKILGPWNIGYILTFTS